MASTRPWMVNEFSDVPFFKSAFLDYSGDVDWHGFQISSQGDHALSLTHAIEDFDLHLYNSSGDLLASGERRGQLPELFTANLGPGKYLLRVTGYDGAFDSDISYRLAVGGA